MSKAENDRAFAEWVPQAMAKAGGEVPLVIDTWHAACAYMAERAGQVAESHADAGCLCIKCCLRREIAADIRKLVEE
uniref:Uncharacterized protein n=1 Tax=viral metagenome TaxID=1070528 RepID=A0A6M3JG04_9ZZZZ